MARLRRDILEHRALRAALEAVSGNAVFAPNPGNAGDGFIALATYHLFDAIGFEAAVVSGDRPDAPAPGRPLVLGGGGGLIRGVYGEPFGLVKRHLEAGGELVVLPSTTLGYEDFFVQHAERITLFCRERYTFDRLARHEALRNRVHLCHDLFFAIDPGFYEAQRRRTGSGVLRSLRGDSEGLSGGPGPEPGDIQLFLNGFLWHDRALCERIVSLYADYVGDFSEVETDRLHLAALAGALGRRTVMHPNSYFKNQGVYQQSLQVLPNVVFRNDLAEDGGIGTAMPVDLVAAPSVGIDRPSAAGAASKDVRRRQFEWEAFREKTAYLDQQLESARAEVREFERTKSTWWDPEIKRLTDRLERKAKEADRYAAARAEVENRIRTEVEPAFARMRADLESATARLQQKAQDADAAERSLAAMSQDLESAHGALAEYQHTKETWWDPELNRLTDELVQAKQEVRREAAARAEAHARVAAMEKLTQFEMRPALEAALAKLRLSSAQHQHLLASSQALRLRAESTDAQLLAAEKRIQSLTSELGGALAAAARSRLAMQHARRGLIDAEERVLTYKDRALQLQEAVDGWFKPRIEHLSSELADLTQRNSVAESAASELQGVQTEARAVRASLDALQASRTYRFISFWRRLRRARG